MLGTITPITNQTLLLYSPRTIWEKLYIYTDYLGAIMGLGFLGF